MEDPTFITENKDRTDEEGRAHDLINLISDAGEATQATRLLKKKKELREVDETLEMEKAQYRNRMESLLEREKKLFENQQRMKEQVQRFERFVRENNIKKERAEAKFQQEAQIRRQEEKEEERLKESHASLIKENEQILEEIDRLSRYRLFFEKVVETYPDHFETIHDVLKRHKTLQRAQHDLETSIHTSETYAEERSQMLRMMQLNFQNTSLMANSRVYDMQKDLERLRALSLKARDEYDHQEQRRNSLIREGGQVLASLQNLHRRCVQVSSKRKASSSQQQSSSAIPSLSAMGLQHVLHHVDEQLEVVGQKIEDLIDVQRQWSRLASETARLGQGRRKRGTSHLHLPELKSTQQQSGQYSQPSLLPGHSHTKSSPSLF